MTVLGPKAALNNNGNSLFLCGAQIRRNSSISIINSIIAGWPQGLLIDASKGVPTDNNITSTSSTLVLQNNIIAGCPQPLVYSASTTTPTGATTASILTWFSTAAFSNTMLANNTDAGLTAPFNYTAPDFNPSSAASPAATGASFTHPKSSGLQSVSYKGACAVGDTWWKGWTKY